MWTLYLFHVRTGRIGPRVEGQFSWSLSETDGSISLTLKKSEIPKFGEDTPYLSPWWGGVVLFWNETPIMAGPITGLPTEDFKEVQISVKSIWSIFSRRNVVHDMVNWNNAKDPKYLTGWTTNADPKQKSDSAKSFQLKESPYYYNKELYSIARLIVEVSCANKQGADLPIDFSAVPIKTNTTDDAIAKELTKAGSISLTEIDENRVHSKHYKGYNFTTVASALNDLSDLTGGPAITFRPYIDLSTLSVKWKMLTGLSESKPKLNYNNETVWDTTAAGGDISNLSVTSSGAKQTTRVFAKPPGNNAGFAVNTNTDMLNKGYPLLETSATLRDATRASMQDATSLSLNLLNLDSKPRRTLSGTIRANSEVHPLGTYWPGDIVKLVVKGWYAFPEGIINARIDSISGDSSMNISVSFAEEASEYEYRNMIESITMTEG